MKRSFLFLVLTLAAHASDWRLVWSDEFDRPGAPDPAKWNYEQGFERNQELQYYTNRSKNVRIENGHLVLDAYHEALPNPIHKAGDADWRKARAVSEYTSASLTTRSGRPSERNTLSPSSTMPRSCSGLAEIA